MFFFFLNDEKRIGFKKLTLADLGLGDSHQTHIGLYGNVCTFLKDTDEVKQAMLIYNDYCDILTCSFDRISTPTGVYRSAKIRTGENKDDSVVGKIREFAKQKPNIDWYLAWSGLESEELVFWLISSDSEDFQLAKTIFPPKVKILDENAPTYNIALDFLLRKVNMVSCDIQKELEIASQIGSKQYDFKPIDLDKAQQQFKQIGKKGEELVAEYLEKQKAKGIIRNFIWCNKSRESGMPYDFLIDNNHFVDVKSTSYDFNQSIFFSGNEVDFVSQLNNANYSVFRIFDMNVELHKLRICKECAQYMMSMQSAIKHFESQVLNQNSTLQTVKLGVEPTYCFKDIQPEIIL